METQVISCDGFAVSSLFFSSTDSMGARIVCSELQIGRWMSTIEWACMPYAAIINLRTVLCLVSIMASQAYGSISIVCGGGGILLWLSACANGWNQAVLLLLFGPGNEAVYFPTVCLSLPQHSVLDHSLTKWSWNWLHVTWKYKCCILSQCIWTSNDRQTNLWTFKKVTVLG